MTKRELEQILRNNIKIQSLKAKIEDLTYKSIVNSQQITGMPFVSGTSDKVGDYATDITELEDKHIRLVIINSRLIKRANEFIWSIPDETNTISLILYLKYLQGKDNLDIADEVDIRGPYREKVIDRIINTFFLDVLLYM